MIGEIIFYIHMLLFILPILIIVFYKRFKDNMHKYLKYVLLIWMLVPIQWIINDNNCIITDLEKYFSEKESKREENINKFMEKYGNSSDKEDYITTFLKKYGDKEEKDDNKKYDIDDTGFIDKILGKYLRKLCDFLNIEYNDKNLLKFSAFHTGIVCTIIWYKIFF